MKRGCSIWQAKLAASASIANVFHLFGANLQHPALPLVFANNCRVALALMMHSVCVCVCVFVCVCVGVEF